MSIARYSRIFFSSIKDKVLLKELSNIAIPLLITNLINSCLQLIDQLMLSSLGIPTLTAVGIVNQFSFLMAVAFLSIAASGGIFFSRLWKQNDINQIKKLQVILLYMELIISIIFVFVSLIYTEPILMLYSSDKEVIKIGTTFLSHTVFGQPLLALSSVYIYLFRVSDYSRIATKGSIIAIIINTFLNYCFIYGNLGAPKLGVAGAGISTTIARIAMLLYYLYHMRFTVKHFILKLKNFICIDFGLLKKLISVASSLVIGELLLALSHNFVAGVFAHFGTVSGASYAITLTMRQFLILAVGSVVPSAMILIGYKIGSNSSAREIRIFCLKIQGIGFYMSLLIGIIILILEPLILTFGYQNIPLDVYKLTMTMILIMILFSPMTTANNIFSGAIFRSGGSNSFNLVIVIIAHIFVGALGAYFISQKFNYIIFVYLWLYVGDAIRFIANVVFFRFGKWLKPL